MNIEETILHIQKVAYYENRSPDIIRSGIRDLEEIPESSMSPRNANKKKALLALLRMKLATEEAFKGGFTREKGTYACRVIEESKEAYKAAQFALNPKYVSEADKFAALKESVYEVADFVDQIEAACAKLVDGTNFVGSLDDYYKVKEQLFEVPQREWAQYFPETANKDFYYISVHDELQWLMNKKFEAVKVSFLSGVNVGEDAFRDTVDLYEKYNIVPSMKLSKGTAETSILFVSTPLVDEFDILLNANKNSNSGKKNIMQLETDWLRKGGSTQEKTRERFTRALAAFTDGKTVDIIAVYGVNDLPESIRKGVFLAISEFCARKNESIFFAINDRSGKMSCFDEYMELRKANKEMLCADNKYLRLPTLEDFKREKRGMSADEIEEIRLTCPFMGYKGLNTYLQNEKRDPSLALLEMQELSKLNLQAAREFLNDLVDLSKFIPYDWKWSEVKRPDTDSSSSGAYDYDQIRDVSDAKILAILGDPGYDIYGKCGELVKYMLLSDEDKSIWKNVLDADERERRIQKAVRVIAYTMRVFYTEPNVEICNTTEGKWGGLCVNGGETIKFKNSCAQDIDWTMDAILHELFHSLQSTILYKNVDVKWYKKNYHISNERIETWRDNHQMYAGLDTGNDDKQYWVQTYETDARDFAGLCLGDQVYHNHEGYRS